MLLWPDTFTSAFAPQIGVAAVTVLEALGYDVVVPRRPVCCGLTWHSTGQLTAARRALRRALRLVEPAVRLQLPVVGLEPSCTAMLQVEAGELVAGAKRLGALVQPFAKLVAAHDGPWPFAPSDAHAVVQPHCHQQATVGFDAEAELLERLGIRPDLVAAGCCGLAGNFGYERGHWDVAQALAELQLYPAVRAADPHDLILADGFSCRTQIAQGTGRTASHLAEVLAAALPS